MRRKTPATSKPNTFSMTTSIYKLKNKRGLRNTDSLSFIQFSKWTIKVQIFATLLITCSNSQMIVPVPLFLAGSNPRVLARLEIARAEIHAELGGMDATRAKVNNAWHLGMIHFSLFVMFQH